MLTDARPRQRGPTIATGPLTSGCSPPEYCSRSPPAAGRGPRQRGWRRCSCCVSSAAGRWCPGCSSAWLVRYLVAAVVTLPGTVAVTGVRYYLSVLVIITAAMLPYAADRLLAPRLPGLAATFGFPRRPGKPGVSDLVRAHRHDQLSRQQPVRRPSPDAAGVADRNLGDHLPHRWFASVVNWAWERGFVWPRIRTGTVLYAAVCSSYSWPARRGWL